MKEVTRARIEATPEWDRAEEEMVSDPARLSSMLDGPWGEVLPGDPLSFSRRWGSARLRLLLVNVESGHLLPPKVPGLLKRTSTSASPNVVDLSPFDNQAFIQRWHERYGAEVFFMNGTELQLAVPRPPVSQGEVTELAIEQYAYCDDLLDVIELGNGQVRSNYWSFWWD
ncbi:DUF4253 domain-containing protein [Streptomyces sp. NPDC050504]|uniref:DUF4253 domain-containing protein n=1 Tax=Streptomyces sp. NPDC050504 TaxID=3365618 RepID=UPI0037A84219